jgi:hypothetical protein
VLPSGCASPAGLAPARPGKPRLTLAAARSHGTPGSGTFAPCEVVEGGGAVVGARLSEARARGRAIGHGVVDGGEDCAGAGGRAHRGLAVLGIERTFDLTGGG